MAFHFILVYMQIGRLIFKSIKSRLQSQLLGYILHSAPCYCALRLTWVSVARRRHTSFSFLCHHMNLADICFISFSLHLSSLSHFLEYAQRLPHLKILLYSLSSNLLLCKALVEFTSYTIHYYIVSLFVCKIFEKIVS